MLAGRSLFLGGIMSIRMSTPPWRARYRRMMMEEDLETRRLLFACMAKSLGLIEYSCPDHTKGCYCTECADAIADKMFGDAE